MMLTLMRSVALLAAVAGTGVASANQDQSTQSTPAPTPSATPDGVTSDQDLVVQGTLEGPLEGPPVELKSATGSTSQVTRVAASDAAMFARCARTPPRRLLTAVLDGPVNNPTTEWALDRIIRTNVGCYQSFSAPFLPPPPPPYFGECNPQTIPGVGEACRALFDRGALIEKALADYAPDLKLTRVQTRDRSIQARVRAREDVRGRSRIAADRAYFDVALCLVMFQPERAVRLIHSRPGSVGESSARTMMLALAPTCVGGAKKVTVDPAQFRVYIADALYSWAVALRGVDSLIPA